jgi:predicted dehydrogenase
MSTEKLRIGIIGMGLVAATGHVPDSRGTGRAEVVAAARRSADRLAMAKRELEIPATYTDWREMLAHEELDAVVVSTPHDQHVEPTVAALERGLHVLLEKPLATSVADAQTILRAAQQSDRVVMMAVNRRGDPVWRTAQRLLAAGDIGRVRQVTAVMCGDLRVFREVGPLAPELQQWLDSMSEMRRTYALDIITPGSWRQDAQQMGGDMLADTGSHTIDLLFWLAGASAVEVMAYSPADRPRQAAIITIQALLSNGVILSITFNDHVAMGDEFNFRGSGQLAVFGDKGTLTGSVPIGASGDHELVIERNGERQPVVVEGETISPAAAFVAAILDGAPNVATVDDAARVVAFIQGAYRSAAERRIVSLEEDL